MCESSRARWIGAPGICELTLKLYLYNNIVMEDIDPKLLRAFLHVARERSFAAAARTLGLPPSTVSLRIRALERKLQTRLFERNGRHMALVPAAPDLLPAAREIVDMHDRLFECAASISVRDSVGPGFRPPEVADSAGPKSAP